MTPEIRDEVIKMYQDGYSIKQIAKKTMYSTTNIYVTLRLYNVAVLGKKERTRKMYKALKLKVGEQNLCPFPHKHDKTGKEYMEKTPSCGINEHGAFNCFVCGRGYTDENWFTSAYLNCSLKQAEKFNKMLKETRLFLPSKTKWQKNQKRLVEELKNKDSDIYKYLKELDLLSIVETARMGIYQSRLTLPTFYKGQIINLCQFCPGEVPKYRNSASAITGIITTTKTFNQDLDYILVAAGEKDMLQATKFGFNAVTILGGEKAKPHYYKNLFRNKKIYIAYDNDKAGMEGALDLAEWLYRYSKEIKVLNVSDVFNEKDGDLTTVAKEDKEDLTDFFIKYNKNDLDLWNVIENSNWYQPPALENKSVIALINDVHKTLKELEKRLEEEKTNVKYKKKMKRSDFENLYEDRIKESALQSIYENTGELDDYRGPREEYEDEIFTNNYDQYVDEYAEALGVELE